MDETTRAEGIERTLSDVNTVLWNQSYGFRERSDRDKFPKLLRDILNKNFPPSTKVDELPAKETFGDDEIALTQAELDALPEYSFSIPTGTTIGKRWKCMVGSNWKMGEYQENPNPSMVSIKWRKILLLTEKEGRS